MNIDLDDLVPNILSQAINREGVTGTKSYLDLLCEYWHLASCERLSELQADRLENLLELAESDTLLSLLFNEANYFVAKELELLDRKRINDYRKFQDDLKDFLSGQELVDWEKRIISPNIPAQSSNLPSTKFPQNISSLLQHRLKFKGYYGGPVDGYFGPISEDALHAFQRDNNLTDDKCSSGEKQLGAGTVVALLME